MQRERLLKAEKVAGISTLVTFILAFLKLSIGLISGATVLVADAIHSGGDLLSIGASYLGIRISRKPPTEKFPYGLYKVETLFTLFISLLILLAGIELLREGWGKLNTPSFIERKYLAFGIATFSGITAWFLSHWQKKTARAVNSPSLMANAEESLTDIFTSLVVFLGILASSFRMQAVEGLATMSISFFVVWIGWKNGRLSIYGLLDASIAPELERNIAKTLISIKGIKDVEKVRIRQAGLVYLGEAHIQVERSADVARAHEIAHEGVAKVKKRFPHIEALTIHIEPYKPKKWRVMIPVGEKKDNLDGHISPHFGRAKYFLFVTMQDGKVNEVSIEENLFQKDKARAALSVVRDLVGKRGINAVITKEMGEIAFHALRDNFVEIYKFEGDKVEEALKQLASSALPFLTQPTHPSEGGPRQNTPEVNSEVEKHSSRGNTVKRVTADSNPRYATQNSKRKGRSKS